MGLMPDLLIDVGNSRIKWACVQPAAPWIAIEPEAAPHDASIATLVASLPPVQPGRIAVSQVLGAEAGKALHHALQVRYGLAPVFAQVRADWAGLRVAYLDPSRLGVDRWLAMLAARHQSPGVALVVAMAGTALTLDAVAADGRHLGGFIAPGLHAARHATLGATRFEYQVRDTGQHVELGQDTEACVDAGARLACLGALDRGAALAPPGAQRWIAGGDAPALIPDLPGWSQMPNPVLLGLMAMLNASDY